MRSHTTFTRKAICLSLWTVQRYQVVEAEPDFHGGAKRDRTADLLRARQALSQLSYGPKVGKTVSTKARSFWWVWADLNCRLKDFQSLALTPELLELLLQRRSTLPAARPLVSKAVCFSAEREAHWVWIDPSYTHLTSDSASNPQYKKTTPSVQ